VKEKKPNTIGNMRVAGQHRRMNTTFDLKGLKTTLIANEFMPKPEEMKQLLLKGNGNITHLNDYSN
jgi:hypothetical protein